MYYRELSSAVLYIAMDKGLFQAKASGAKMIAPLATGQFDAATGTPRTTSTRGA